MEETPVHNKLTHSPPKRGFSLGWRLAFSTALVISFVMGGISVRQQLLELRKDREIRQELLQISLVPLAVRLEAAASLEAKEREVREFHAAYVQKEYPVHDLVLLDAKGKQVLSTRTAAVAEKNDDYFQAEVAIVSPLLDGGKGTLKVLKSIQEYRNTERRNWLLWAAHFTLTVGVVSLFLAVVIYFQVTKPVNQLVQGVKKMEMGYWGPIEVGDGAWEIRWLAWRFGNMVQEVRNSVTHLFDAERKARSLNSKRAGNRLPQNPQRPLASDTAEFASTNSPVYRELTAVCKQLESASPNDVQAVQFARGVWQHEALEADQLGFHQLKARLEDAALRLLEPDEYTDLDKRLSQVKASWREWAEQQGDTLYRMLEDKQIPCARVLHRVKHTAGVWAKMHGKGLGLDEVYDLFAFRIIVPTEADCYASLGVIHKVYKPEVSRFKDYIVRSKGNGYRSLHTCVKAGDGPVFEIQIRSVAMDRQAERGGAAHWLYKKGGREMEQEPTMLKWWDRIRRWPRDAARRPVSHH